MSAVQTENDFGLLGKIPTRDDFVHVGPRDPAFLELDGWLVKGVEWAAARRPAWSEAFAQGGLRAFVFRSRQAAGQQLLAGTMAPSADRAGRQFPVVVARPVWLDEAALATPHGLPLILETWWQIAGQSSHELRTGAHAEALQSLTAPPIETGASLAEALAEYEAWTAELPIDELWALLYGAEPGHEPSLGLRLLVEAVRVCRGVERPETPLSLRLPLGSSAGAGVCFWIDLTRRLLGWRATVPSFFWSHDGASGELLLHLGTPPVSTVAELWLPTRDRDEVCDVTPPLPPHLQTLPELPPALSDVFGRRGTAGELLRAAGA